MVNINTCINTFRCGASTKIKRSILLNSLLNWRVLNKTIHKFTSAYCNYSVCLIQNRYPQAITCPVTRNKTCHRSLQLAAIQKRLCNSYATRLIAEDAPLGNYFSDNCVICPQSFSYGAIRDLAEEWYLKLRKIRLQRIL